MISFVCALEKEAKCFLDSIKNKKEYNILGKKVFVGKIKNKKFSLIISEIGKVNAAVSTQILIDKFKPSVIINFGTAGGLTKETKKFNYYVSTGNVQYDFNLSELDNCPIGFIQGFDRIYFPSINDNLDFLDTCIVASGDRVSGNKTDYDIVRNMNANVKDMEAGAISQTCLINNIPLYVIKGITDEYGNNTEGEQYYKNLTKVCEGFKELITKVVESIKFK